MGAKNESNILSPPINRLSSYAILATMTSKAHVSSNNLLTGYHVNRHIISGASFLAHHFWYIISGKKLSISPKNQSS